MRRVLHPERLAIFLDHAVPAPNAEHALNHKEVREFVAEQGIAHFYEAGRGICHQVISEEALVAPGQLLLGADSHTTHIGWLGAFGAGIGRSEMAAIWATGELWLRVPETIRVDLEGELPPGVTSKDLGLWLLKLLGPEAGIYRALEFGGPGLRTLSIESRMVLPNLMAESGAKSAYLEPDAAVFEWLAKLGLDAADADALTTDSSPTVRGIAGSGRSTCGRAPSAARALPRPGRRLPGAPHCRPGRAGADRGRAAQPGQGHAALAGRRHAHRPGVPGHLHQRPAGRPGRGRRDPARAGRRGAPRGAGHAAGRHPRVERGAASKRCSWATSRPSSPRARCWARRAVARAWAITWASRPPARR